jgi:hypothetical protein
MLLTYVCTCVSVCVCAQCVGVSEGMSECVEASEGRGAGRLTHEAAGLVDITLLNLFGEAQPCQSLHALSRATFCVSFLCTPCDLAQRAGSCSPTRHAQTMQRTDHATRHAFTIASV